MISTEVNDWVLDEWGREVKNEKGTEWKSRRLPEPFPYFLRGSERPNGDKDKWAVSLQLKISLDERFVARF